MNTVDIIIPIYNMATSLAAALDSVLAQTYTDWVCHLVDDGSIDHSAQICSEYVARDRRFKFYRLRQNGGISRALNVGISKGSAPFIARLDADDEWLPFHLELLVKEMELHSDIDLIGTRVFTNKAFIHQISKPERYMATSGETLYYGLVESNKFNHPTVLIRRSALGDMKYEPAYDGYEDYHLWARLVTPTNSMVLHVPSVYYHTGTPKSRPVDMMQYRQFKRRLELSRKNQ